MSYEEPQVRAAQFSQPTAVASALSNVQSGKQQRDRNKGEFDRLKQALKDCLQRYFSACNLADSCRQAEENFERIKEEFHMNTTASPKRVSNPIFLMLL